MDQQPAIVVRQEPEVNPDELWRFYVQNNVCEQRYGKERATSVLGRSDVVVSARDDGKLIGVARAITDGLDAAIMELSVALSHQGTAARQQNGSLVEDDTFGIGKRLAEVLVEALLARGACFIQSGSVYQTVIPVYEAAGFSVNAGHVPMYLDHRPPWPD